jgi:hypothetical protein
MGAMTAALSRATDRVYLAFGETAVFTDRTGEEFPCVALVEQDLARYGETAQVNVKTVVLSVRKTEVPEAPRRGDVFTLTGPDDEDILYKVDSLQGSTELEHKVFAA